MALEIVSTTSKEKDTDLLPKLYLRAGVREYWLVQPRGKEVEFDILHRGSKGFARTRKQNGWIKSRVFGRSFRLSQGADALGLTAYRLEVR